MPESDQAGELTPGAAIEWEPVDLASVAIVDEHDRSRARERAQAFGAVITAISAKTISAKCRMRICDGTDDVIDAAASSRELGGDATGTRLIMGPDAAAEREGARVSKGNRFGLVSKRSDADRGAEGLFVEDAGVGGNVSEERRFMRDVVRSCGQCSVAPRESASST